MLGRKVIYVRCINCSYNNVAKGIRLLDKKHPLFIQENFMQVRAFERYIPITIVIISYVSSIGSNQPTHLCSLARAFTACI